MNSIWKLVTNAAPTILMLCNKTVNKQTIVFSISYVKNSPNENSLTVK